MQTYLKNLLEKLSLNIWLIPLAMMLAGIVAAAGSLHLDQIVSAAAKSRLEWFGPGNVVGTRALLSTLTAALVTVVGVVFSVIVVVLTLASSQFGPRLIRNFMRDRVTQVVIGLFMASFTYNVVLLGALDGAAAAAQFPQITSSSSIVLALFAISGFVFLIHHVATSIRAEHLIEEVADDFRLAIDTLIRQAASGDNQLAAPSAPSAPAVRISAPRSGYVQAVDYRRILEAAEDKGATVFMRIKPGHFVLEGSEIAIVDEALADPDGFSRDIANAVIIGNEASPEQDVEFAVRQLVDIAVRALSPGINDPHTAIVCIDHLCIGLTQAERCGVPSSCVTGENEEVRVVRRADDLSDYVDAAFDQIRQYGRDSIAVNVRLLENITELGRVVNDSAMRAALMRQTEAVVQGLEFVDLVERDRNVINERVAAALTALRS